MNVAIVRDWIFQIFRFIIKSKFLNENPIKYDILRKLLSYRITKTPISIMVEPICQCNLKCPLCTTPHKYMTREKGMMRMETFQKLLDDTYRFVLHYDFDFAGEPFLHPQLFKMVRLASDRGVFTIVDSNGTLINDRRINEILDSRLNVLAVNIDNANQRTFEEFRLGADFNKTIEQIKRLCERKKEEKLTFPFIIAEIIVSRENERELQIINNLALNEIGVDAVFYKSICFPLHSDGFRRDNPVQELVDKYLPIIEKVKKRYNIVNGELKLKNPTFECNWRKKSLVLWDGRVSVCCYDYDGQYTFGNVNEDHFLDIWNSPKYRYYREKLIYNKKLALCRRCAYSF
ncbi:MAG: radical SAM protein [Promethearchaeota archaeon]|nr:MAG: radical SAM protein [Candidatus Lokiarchaeota archaeon]